MDTKLRSIWILLSILLATPSTISLPAIENKVKGIPSVHETLRVISVGASKGQIPQRQPPVKFFTRTNVQFDLCPLCIQFIDEAITNLINIILDAGVLKTCGSICDALAERTGSQVLGEACTLLCDIAGVKAFMKLVEKADLDPIYFCEELKTCPVFDGGDAFITKIAVTPESGLQGMRDIEFDYTSRNGTGTGQIVVDVHTLDKIPIGTGFLQEPKPAGKYSGRFKLKAKPDPDCDPFKESCETWPPGNYTLDIAICNGMCGSKRPHCKVYDRKEHVFVIT